MQEGKTLFAAKKYTEAAAKFATAADRWPDSPLEEDALFLKGESEFFSDQYPKAHDTYGGLLKKYSNTRHLDFVVYREFDLGRYWEQLHNAKPLWPVTPNVTDSGRPMFDTFGYAIQAYQRVREHDPTGPLADHSLMALGNAYFRRGQFEEAGYNYDLLRKQYPNSKHQMLAHVLELQAKMRVYQGTWYDGAPLNEAAKIADQALTQFGEKLGAERERVAQARAQIMEEKANREFSIAQYYDRRKEFRAARIYYQSVIDDFPGTAKAKEARARLEQIRGEPDVPPNRFAWLTRLFESEKK
jgi:outer membrane protein assembly factor BamD (BamD/ComL family)